MARILMLTSRLPYPPREGHQLRSWHLLRALASAHEVTLLSFVRSDDLPDQCAPLRAAVSRLETFPILAEQSRTTLAVSLAKSVLGARPFVAEKYASLRLRARVAELAGAADVVHVDMLPLMGLVAGLPVVPPLVLNAHNVEHRLLRQRAAIETRAAQRLFLRGQIAKLAEFERAACRRAARVLACSHDDADELALLAPRTPVSVVPNGVDIERIDAVPRAAPQAAQLVFVGQMGWFPNRDGVAWFLDEILPRILERRPDTTFVVVGRSDGLKVPARVAHAVRPTGFVDDVAPLVRASVVYVVPLRSGSGTRLKVLEAMACARPIVSTRIGAQGIDLTHERDVLFADDAACFARAVLGLLDDAQRAARLGAAARALAQARYDWSTIGRELLAVYGAMLADQRTGAPARQR
jgi:glycosyltransferase involved in cell wall biosynthesis